MKEIDALKLNVAPADFAKGWMLLTAGTQERGFNTMTCSWGHIGSIWGTGGGLPTAICYVRPQRYTKEFMDREDLYTISFFPDTFKADLAYLGSHSGKDEDKLAKTGLTPVFEEGCTYFREAKLVLVCRKLYQAPLKEDYFVDQTIVSQHYPQKDFHDLYIGQIVRVLQEEV
ncbi:MAG: flavin reductase [Oscillospiraceae bacterium]|nr:flavin reductase [Oscillospiraceae bacterium]